MSTLTRYTARLYLVNILVMFVVLFSLVVSVDVVINLGRFSQAASQRIQEEAVSAGAASTSGKDVSKVTLVRDTIWVILDLWGPRLLQLFNHLVGVVLIAAMGFTCTQLVRHREFVAMLASGISLHRAARPLVLVAVGVALIQFANQEFVVPRVAHLLARDVGEAGKSEVGVFRVKLAPDDQGRLLVAQRFYDKTNTLEGLRVWERDGEGRVTRVITADKAEWDGKSWVLTKGEARTPSTVGGGAATPIERVETSLDPLRLKVRHLQGFGQALGWRQIGRILERGGLDAQARARLERLRWSHLSALACNIVTLLAAMPFFLVRSPGPMMLPALKAAPIAMAGLVATAVGSSAALPGLPAWLSAFVPCLVLLPLSIALYTGVKT